MNPDDLRGKLIGLHDLLSRSPAVDADSRQLLRTLVQDIEKLLDRVPPATSGPAAADTASPSVHGSRLEELATRLEADHPAITGALLQLADLLGKAGI